MVAAADIQFSIIIGDECRGLEVAPYVNERSWVLKFALVDDVRRESQPKTRGKCPSCGAETIAKCGRSVVWHWAHKSLGQCDHWWESETQWHRAWKNRFPPEWQEIVRCDEVTGERHVADVQTTAGLVIEFQRSPIELAEVVARQRFYDKMVWVVDGCRNELDREYFALSLGRRDEHGIAGFRWYGKSRLFARWHTTKPVFIDFGPSHGFWRLLRFNPSTKQGVIAIVDIPAFVTLISAGTTDFSINGGPATTDC